MSFVIQCYWSLILNQINFQKQIGLCLTFVCFKKRFWPILFLRYEFVDMCIMLLVLRCGPHIPSAKACFLIYADIKMTMLLTTRTRTKCYFHITQNTKSRIVWIFYMQVIDSIRISWCYCYTGSHCWHQLCKDIANTCLLIYYRIQQYSHYMPQRVYHHVLAHHILGRWLLANHSRTDACKTSNVNLVKSTFNLILNLTPQRNNQKWALASSHCFILAAVLLTTLKEVVLNVTLDGATCFTDIDRSILMMWNV